MSKIFVTRWAAGTAAVAGLLLAVGAPQAVAQKGTLVIKGSDTMVNLSQAWAEAYMKANPGARISVTGGGSGTGIAAFINGTCDIANSSRPMSGSEIGRSKERGIVPQGTVCALDGLAIAVHSSNPIKEISVPEIGRVFAGGINDWNQLGGKSGKIVVLSRESSSGTFVYFRDNVLKGKPYRSDALLMPSTKAIATEIAKNAGAIGYGGEAYFRDQRNIKIIPVARREGEAAVMPTDESVQSRKYPIARPLFMYTPGKPSGLASNFIKFCLGAEGQKIVKEVGYTPLK
jgi:phosphate transport system substrate-binding protein